MQIKQIISLGALAISTQAAVINHEVVNDKRTDTVTVAADIPGVLDLGVGVGADVSLKTREANEKRLIDLSAEVVAQIADLLGLDVGLNVTAKREIDEQKRLLDLSAEVAAQIADLLGLDVGLNVTAKRDDTVVADIGADVLGLIDLGVGVDADIALKKREANEKRLIDLSAEVAAQIADLLGLDVGLNVTAKRDDTVVADIGADVLGLIDLGVGVDADIALKRRSENASIIEKRLISLSADVVAQIAGLLGLDVGVDVNAKRDDKIAATVAADIAHLIDLGVGVGADINLKRDISVSAEVIAKIAKLLGLDVGVDADVAL
ncbi:uncharacterized protein KGF55_000823 [Candida pseudojiufengensis]|uniref:uncharacterized protein n=1 Tax=Candida pseudojiufengensis TaxID=497109 RepID=UPI002225AEC7|nr:uncharacterized protein KGF55_000823 [Candida pseudojiufengensis]KAI5966514.1 hypothetical protein KGF55_000823 [Candida pseudojiufengensis]